MSDLGDQRRYYERMIDEIANEHRQQIDQLESENSKLRELVRDIADHVNHGDGFGIDRGWMLERMRELGVEV